MLFAWSARSGDGFADDHPAGTPRPGQLGVHHPDRSGADHQHGLAGLNVQGVLTAQHAGEGFHQRCHRRIHRFADPDHIALLDRFRSHAHVLGETAIDGDPDGVVIGAQVVVPAHALGAVPAAGVGGNEYAFAHG